MISEVELKMDSASQITIRFVLRGCTRTDRDLRSLSTIWPARAPAGGIQRNVLNSLLPAAVNGCGFDISIGCLASTLIAFASVVVTS